MKNRFKICTGTATDVESELNTLMQADNFVRIVSSSGGANDLCVIAYVKPNKDEKDAQS